MHAAADTIAGLNLRPKDNLIQAVAIGVAAVIGAAIGGLVAPASQRFAGLVLGGIAGLVLGLFASGIALGLYRLVTRMRGR